MKAILEFNLPEDKDEFELAQKAVNYSIVIHEMDNYLRARLKYEDLPEEIHNALQEARDKLTSLQQENDCL